MRILAAASATMLLSLLATPADARPVAQTAPAAKTAKNHWKRVYTQPFDKPAALGRVGTVYGAGMNGYPDGTRTTHNRGSDAPKNGGCWWPSKVLSVHDGYLDYHLHDERASASCRHLSAAPLPQGWDKRTALTYGRYEVEMRADPLAGYKTAFLLWPLSGDWGDGEFNGPEGSLNGYATAAAHALSPADPSTYIKVRTKVKQAGRHRYTTEWTPGHIRFLIDGVLIKDFTKNVPANPHVMVLQVETAYGPLDRLKSGHLRVYRITIDKYVP